MDDLISRQAALDALYSKVRYTDHEEPVVDWNELCTALIFLPSAKKDIIRCCECVHWNQDAAKQNKSFCDNYLDDIWTDWTAADWYCADAERREDGRS